MEMDYPSSFRRLLVALIVLNVLDGALTAIGLSSPHLSEANPLMASLATDLSLMLSLKLVALTLLLAGALLYVAHTRRAFPKEWENRTGLVAAGTVTLLYAAIVVNDAVAILHVM